MRRVLSKVSGVIVAGALAVSMLPIAALGSDGDGNVEQKAGVDAQEPVPLVPSEKEDINGGVDDLPSADIGSDDAKEEESPLPDEESPDMQEESSEADDMQAVEPVEEDESEAEELEALAPEDNVTAFVTRLYRYVLNRNPDAGGLAVQVEALRSGTSAADIAWGFFGSSEFGRRNLTNDQKIDIAYLAMFDRSPDGGGKAIYKAMLDAGMGIRTVIAAFSQSAEYRALCAKWGVTPGVLVVVENRDMNPNATAFVQRLYQKVLGRSADMGGLNTHTGSLLSGKSAADVAWAFFGSPEFAGRNLSNAQRVDIAYLAMFDRNPDGGGKANFKAKLDLGMSMRAVISDFSNSAEYRALCARWGVTPGSLGVVEPRDRNQNVTAFVQRLYRKVLGRSADTGGLNAQAGVLLSSGSAAAVAWAFLGSPEFESRNLSNEQKIEMAYQAMFDRSADASGMATFKAKLDLGMSLRAVLADFSRSAEYRALCDKWGVVAGTLNVAENRDRNQNYTDFVQRFYQKVLGRTADAGGLNTYTGLLLSGGDATELSWIFFSSQEFKNRNLSNEGIVNVAYQAMLNRDPDPDGKAEWTRKLNEGMSLRSFISGFASSEEFRLLCKKYGIEPDRYWSMDSRADRLYSPTGWLIAVDTNKCLVSVYNGSQGDWHAVNRFECAPGKASTPSRKGVFSVGIKGYVFGSGYSCYYYTQYSGDYLFHSILYDPGTFNVQDAAMGYPASHGCIRLWLENAIYIYYNVPYGSTVVVF